MKKRLCPNARDSPCAMLDKNGNILTSNKAIEERALEMYSERLTGNEMKEQYLLSISIAKHIRQASL